MTDPYRILGVKITATAHDIKKSYRKLAREHHPDRRPGDKRAEERFKDISTAYDLLSDPTKRRQFDAGEIDAMGNKRAGFGGTSSGYDAYKRHSSGMGAGAKKSTKPPFSNFFKDRMKRERQSIKARGADVSYTLNVSFLDAALGAEKTVRMTTGKALKVRIPAGTENTQVLRLKNQGMDGIGGERAGDAMVEILIQNDAKFRSEGLDIYSEEPITLAEALLGGQIEAETIHGPVRVTVPEGANSGTKLRLKGKGIHRAHTQGQDTTTRGDHYVTLKVVLPEDEDSELKKFVKKWIKKRPYKVRKDTLSRARAT